MPLILLTHVFFSLGWISHEQLLTALLLVTLVGYIHYSRQEDMTNIGTPCSIADLDPG
jgi:hypothetical protein